MFVILGYSDMLGTHTFGNRHACVPSWHIVSACTASGLPVSQVNSGIAGVCRGRAHPPRYRRRVLLTHTNQAHKKESAEQTHLNIPQYFLSQVYTAMCIAGINERFTTAA